MFTGIIQVLGRIESIQPGAGGMRLTIQPDTAFEDLRVGESIAIEGVCLTAEPPSTGEKLQFFLSTETLDKSTLGGLDLHSRVNLERSLAAGDRLGGHLVMGHVDGVGQIRRLEREGQSWLLEITCPDTLRAYLAPKGSIAVDGVSLTAVEAGSGGFTVAVIPHTYEKTSLHAKGPGSPVNLEVDTIARYVVHYLRQTRSPGAVDQDLLKRSGFM